MIKRYTLFKKVFCITFVCIGSLYAHIQEPAASFQNWHLFKPSQSPCYLESHADKGLEGEIIAGVYGTLKSPLVVCISLKTLPDGPVRVAVQKRGAAFFFTFKEHEGRLWPIDEITDQALMSAMQEGSVLEIRIKDKVISRFSLKGFTKAFKAMETQCPKA